MCLFFNLSFLLLLDHPDHFDAGTDNEQIVQEKCDDDDDSVAMADANLAVRLELKISNRDHDSIYDINPVPGATCQCVETPPWVHHQEASILVLLGLETRRLFHEHHLLEVHVQGSSLHIHQLSIPADICYNPNQHPHVL